jgi:hypothetical protein
VMMRTRRENPDRSRLRFEVVSGAVLALGSDGQLRHARIPGRLRRQVARAAAAAGQIFRGFLPAGYGSGAMRWQARVEG